LVKNTALLFLAAALTAGAATTTGTPHKAKHHGKSTSGAAHKSTKPASHSSASSSSHKSAKGKTSAKSKSKKGKTAQRARRSNQQAPTPERYREIQQALAKRGYLHSEPSGTWDSESTDALKRFQSDQNLTPDGKLNALSLIALGLGPKRQSAQTHPTAPEPAAGDPAKTDNSR